MHVVSGCHCARPLWRCQLGHRPLLGKTLGRRLDNHAGNAGTSDWPVRRGAWPFWRAGRRGTLRRSGWRPRTPILVCRRTGSRFRWRLIVRCRSVGRESLRRRGERHDPAMDRAYAAERDPIHGASLGFSAALYANSAAFVACAAAKIATSTTAPGRQASVLPMTLGRL